jgi:hypothetical protein
MQSSLDRLYAKTLSFLEKEKVPYLLIGGLAVGVLGEPRMTQDVDLIIFIPKKSAPEIIKKAIKAGFRANPAVVVRDIDLKGAFRLDFESLWVDIIISSTEFENSAFKRKKQIELLGKKTYLPSPEDLILLKLIPGRDKDILDIKSIIERYKGKLNKDYLEKWAQKLSDEAEDLRIWNTLKKLLS